MHPDLLDILAVSDRHRGRAHGLSWEEASEGHLIARLEGVAVRVIAAPPLLKNKRTVGRSKDRADIEHLTRLLAAAPKR